MNEIVVHTDFLLEYNEMIEENIRYIIEGYSINSLKNIKSFLKNSFKLDADVIIKKRSNYKVSISFRTSPEEKIRD